MAEVTGIAGPQSRAKADATSARNKSKQFLLTRVGKWAAALFVLLALLFWWRNLPSLSPGNDVSAGAVTDEAQKQLPTAAPSSTSTIQEARWSEGDTNDGSLPIGTWSEILSADPGCKIHFDGGNGVDYMVRYRLHSGEWEDHEPGTYPKADEVQFMLLKPVGRVPVRITCNM